MTWAGYFVFMLMGTSSEESVSHLMFLFFRNSVSNEILLIAEESKHACALVFRIADESCGLDLPPFFESFRRHLTLFNFVRINAEIVVNFPMNSRFAHTHCLCDLCH